MRKRLKEAGFALFFLGVIALVAVEASEAAPLACQQLETVASTSSFAHPD